MDTNPYNAPDRYLSMPDSERSSSPSNGKFIAIAAIASMVAIGCQKNESKPEKPKSSIVQQSKEPQMTVGVHVSNTVNMDLKLNDKIVSAHGDNSTIQITSNFPLQRTDFTCHIDGVNQTWGLAFPQFGTSISNNSFAHPPANGKPPKFYLNGQEIQCAD